MLLKCAVFSPFLKTPSFYLTKKNTSKKFTLWKDYHSSLTKGHTVDLVWKGRNPFIATSNALIALTKHLPSNTFFLQSLFLETHLTVKKNPFGWRGTQRLPSGGHTVTWSIKAVKNWVGVGQGAVPRLEHGQSRGCAFWDISLSMYKEGPLSFWVHGRLFAGHNTYNKATSPN